MCTPILLLFVHAYYAFCQQNAIRPECVHKGVRDFTALWEVPPQTDDLYAMSLTH